MARKPEPPKPENHERWIISYADFITLLFAAFVALYAISSMDAGKASMFQMSVQDALDRPLSEKVVYHSLADRVRKFSPGEHSSSSLIPADNQRCEGTPGEESKTREEEGKANPRIQERMKQLKRDLEGLMEDPSLEGKIEVTQVSDREVMVRLMSAGFFDSGASDPLALAQDVLQAIAAALQPYEDVEVRVEGHTDNVPVRGRFASNWELSTARAGAVVRALEQDFGQDPTRMMSAGYGEFRPVASNDTPAGRAQNRRIDLLIHHPNPRDGDEARSLRRSLGATPGTTDIEGGEPVRTGDSSPTPGEGSTPAPVDEATLEAEFEFDDFPVDRR